MNDTGDAFFWKLIRDNVCNWVFCFFHSCYPCEPFRQSFDSGSWFLNRCCPMELSGTRGGEMQREGPGKMASSLMCESKLLFHGEFLWPFLCHGSRGSWCAMSGAVLAHRPRSAGRGEWWGSAFASSTKPFSGFPGLAAQRLELESQSTGSLTQRPGWDTMWQSDKTQRGHTVPVSLRAE